MIINNFNKIYQENCALTFLKMWRIVFFLDEVKKHNKTMPGKHSAPSSTPIGGSAGSLGNQDQDDDLPGTEFTSQTYLIYISISLFKVYIILYK